MNPHAEVVMLGQFIESCRPREPYGRGLLVSAVVHGTLVLVLLLVAPDLDAGPGEASGTETLIWTDQTARQPDRMDQPVVVTERAGAHTDEALSQLPDPLPAQTITVPDLSVVIVTDVSAPLGDIGRLIPERRVLSGEPRPVRSALPGDGPVSLDRVERAPLVLREPSPIYPSLLHERGIEGSIVVQFTIDVRGRVSPASIRVLEGDQLPFVEEVRRALARARYHPAEIGGRPVPVAVQQRFTFAIGK